MENKDLIQRAATVGTVNSDERKITISILSDTPILEFSHRHNKLVYNSIEINDNTIRNKDFIPNMPFLFEHIREKQIGRVTGITVDGNKLRAEVILDNSETSDAILSGIRTNISAGFIPVKQELTGEKVKGFDVLRTTEIELLECSTVSIPADPTVGVNRSLTNNDKENTMSEENKVEMTKEELAARAAELEKKELELEAEVLAKREAELEAKKAELEAAEEVVNTRSAPAIVVPTEVEYDFGKVFRALESGQSPDGFEGEWSQEMAMLRGKGTYIPLSTRDLLMTNSPSTPKMTAIKDKPFKLVAAELGEYFDGYGNDSVIVPVLDEASFEALDRTEVQADPGQTPSFTNVTLTPNNAIRITLPYSSMANATSAAAVQLVGKLGDRVARKLDSNVIADLIANGQVGTWAAAGAPTMDEIFDAFGAVRSEYDDLNVLLHNTTVAALQKVNDSIGRGYENGLVNGYKAVKSSLIPGANHTMLIVAKDSFAVAVWGGMKIIADPYTLSDRGMTRYTAELLADYKVVHQDGIVVRND